MEAQGGLNAGLRMCPQRLQSAIQLNGGRHIPLHYQWLWPASSVHVQIFGVRTPMCLRANNAEPMLNLIVPSSSAL